MIREIITEQRPTEAPKKEGVARRPSTAEGVMSAGFMGEGIGGVGGLVLAILGLSGVVPAIMLGVATIVLGASLLLQGGTLAAKFAKFISQVEGGFLGETDVGSGITAEFFGGTAGIVLGILALIGVTPLVLESVAAIVLGATLALGSGVTFRLGMLPEPTGEGQERAVKVAQEAITASVGAQNLVGLTAVILGILGLVGLNPPVLSLVAMLCIGAAVMVSGTAFTARMASKFVR